MSRRGVFVAFEGIDGSGKSTQAARVASARRAVLTREPGGTPLGATLRDWLMDPAVALTPNSEALLMLADRAHHVATVIEPALAAGTSVVTDRFAGSTLAYQGYGRGLDLDTLEAATSVAVGSCWPDLTIVLDVPVAVARERRAASGDRFESSGDAFLGRVRDGFRALAASQPRWVLIDGAADERAVAEAIDAHLDTQDWPGDA